MTVNTRNRNEFREMMLVHGIVVAIVFAGFGGVVAAEILFSLAGGLT